MDMEVNTFAFSDVSSRLKKHCGIIEAMTDIFFKKLAAARQNFDDVNYDRTLSAAASVKDRIAAFSGEVKALEKDLKTLEKLVNEYANGGYEG